MIIKHRISFTKYVTQKISFEEYLKLTPQCNGDSFEHRKCNSHNCGSEWTSWGHWAPCTMTCGWNGVQTRSRDCINEAAVSSFNFLTSNLSLEDYLKQYQNCPGIGKQTKKCGNWACSMAPSSRSGLNSVDRETDKSTTKFIDWVGSLLLMKKVTEDIGYSVTVKSTALFLNIKWNNHFRNFFNAFKKMLSWSPKTGSDVLVLQYS